METKLIAPQGGALVNLLLDSAPAAALRAAARDWLSWDLTPRQLCDLELLLNGAFSPLQGFLTRQDYEAVCADMRLANGTLWPMPICLDVPESLARHLRPDQPLALRDPAGVLLAVLRVEEIWQPDRRAEAESIFGTTNREHPGVALLLDQTHPWYVGGRLEGLELPTHYDFSQLRFTPAELRAEFLRQGWARVIAFQTRNPMHRAHKELTLRAARQIEAKLLIHPVVGMTKLGDIDYYTRVRCYQAILPRYPAKLAKLALLPLAMRLAGPREALWHALIRQNYGCTHFIVGRDHAGPGSDAQGRPFYEPAAAAQLLQAYQTELAIKPVPFDALVYIEDLATYVTEAEVPRGARTLNLSGTELRRRLAAGQDLPEWFTFPEVARELRRTHPPHAAQGVTIFFTGLSGAGKSTIANVLRVKLLELGGRPVTLLDGDLVRRHLSSDLGFSKADRDSNIRRIGFVAAEITKNGGIAICAPIAPYEAVRQEVRQLIEASGGFVLVHVATPLEVCEARDRKGLYAKARAGLIANFTGISDPYESPLAAELVLDTTQLSPEAAAQRVLLYLKQRGYLADCCATTDA